MDCEQYKAKHPTFSPSPLQKEVWDTPEHSEWVEHAHRCRECSDWDTTKRVESRGLNVSEFPCVHLAEQVTRKCDDHPDPYDCPDIQIVYSEKFDEYGIPILDGGTSVSCIEYCPWCGKKLPLSKRDLWFDRLEALGIDRPFEQEIPDDFKTDAWWRKEVKE